MLSAGSQAESTWRNGPITAETCLGRDNYMHEWLAKAFSVSEIAWAPSTLAGSPRKLVFSLSANSLVYRALGN